MFYLRIYLILYYQNYTIHSLLALKICSHDIFKHIRPALDGVGSKAHVHVY
jgi:hypothetical protein